ncbi:major facilitator superfamily domain-containing protein 9-like [Adelges cooleyi]|uniref:major facilitator superfamily domain-containing protein 9-like n=1 Tax=Adelges cooleyi TaxID=133065 RepID=UPI002180427A|nr:major facilitator superfamily domain-containing protein 9-like [Adelges cooleyi]XP_050432159.1 major facilitator superfamily domain-containing protein 9-like [Adelges cooleyi]XP_050432160.1 major facilitator superfamily domain-containing protein 9-like [Adelges cooleyi]
MFKYTYIYAIVFLDLISISFIIPVLGTHLRDIGASHFQIALLGSTYSALQFLSGTPIGALSDKYGRKNVLLVTISICAVAYFILGCLKSLVLIAVVRLVQGCVKHTQLLCKTLINDNVPPEKQTTAYGYMNGFSALSFVVGPIVGGHLMEKKEGFYTLACYTALVFFINGIVVWLTVPNTVVNKDTKVKSKKVRNTSPFSDLMEVDWKECWPAFSLKMLSAASMFAFYSSVGLGMTEKFNLSPSEAGYTGAVQGLTGGITGFAAGKIEHIFTSKNPFFKSSYTFALLGAGFVALAISPNIAIFTVALIPISISATLLRGFNNEIVYENSSADHRGLVAGAGASAAAISRFLSPLVCGLTMDMFGSSSGFILSAIFAFVGAILSKFLIGKSKIE